MFGIRIRPHIVDCFDMQNVDPTRLRPFCFDYNMQIRHVFGSVEHKTFPIHHAIGYNFIYIELIFPAKTPVARKAT